MIFSETTRSRRIARVHRKWRVGFTVLQKVDEQHHLLHFKISVQLISCKDVWEVNSWKIEVHSLHWTLYTLALALSTLLLLSSYITLSISQFFFMVQSHDLNNLQNYVTILRVQARSQSFLKGGSKIKGGAKRRRKFLLINYSWGVWSMVTS